MFYVELKVIYLVTSLSWLPSDGEYNIGDEDGDLLRLYPVILEYFLHRDDFEEYQKIISDVIQGCNGVANIADDLIGADLEEHDRNLYTVLVRLRESGLTLYGGKCQFRLHKLTFFGHDLSSQEWGPAKRR